MTIDLSKTYKTKQGNEVKLFMVDKERVLGAYKADSDFWYQWVWRKSDGGSGYEDDFDLVEVVSTVVYCRVYSDGTSYTSCVKPLPLAWFEKQYKKTVTFTEDDLFKD